MARIEELDLADRLAPVLPRWATQIVLGVVCAAVIAVIRAIFDWFAAGAAPFALVFPAIILATLFGRWVAGAVTATLAIGYAYAFVYSASGSVMTGAVPVLSVSVVAIGAILTIAIAEMFRRAVRRAASERDREIAERDLLLAEIDHRVKNNFAIVGSLLDLQKRRATAPETIAALGAAQMRVDSIARAHRHLYRENGGETGMVEMRQYLGDLCAALADALFLRGGIALTCDVDDAAVPRDRAVSIGLVVNELVTNAAKHAFAGRDLGRIGVTFTVRPGGWRVVVADDGVGLPDAAPAPGSGLGSRLIEAFARQAGGTLATASDATGTRVTLEVAA